MGYPKLEKSLLGAGVGRILDSLFFHQQTLFLAIGNGNFHREATVFIVPTVHDSATVAAGGSCVALSCTVGTMNTVASEHLYFPAHVTNHWITVYVNFHKREFSYGE
jgi:hypothetical protein